MRSLALVLLATLSTAAFASDTVTPITAEAEVAHDDATWKYFGEAFTLSQAKPASAVLSDPASFDGKLVRVQGELTEVCQKAGCWAVVRDTEGHTIRIKMKDHAFGIDKDTKGRACDVEGMVVGKEVDQKELDHYATEGATEHPEAGKTHTYELVVSSVAVARS